MAEYVEAYGGDQMLAIGVAPLNSLKYKHLFNTNTGVSLALIQPVGMVAETFIPEISPLMIGSIHKLFNFLEIEC